MIAPFSWTGFYVGAQVGYTWADADHTFSNGAPADNSNPQGGVFGGHMGYNLQNGALVYGIEADLEHTNVRGSFVNPTGITSSGTSDINWQGSVRGRLGFVHQHGLFYLTGSGRILGSAERLDVGSWYRVDDLAGCDDASRIPLHGLRQLVGQPGSSFPSCRNAG